MIPQPPLMVLDIECLPNYFLIAFKILHTEQVLKFDVYGDSVSLSTEQASQITSLMYSHRSFGFNSNNYDIPMLHYALTFATTDQLHALSSNVIHNQLPCWQTYRTLGFDPDSFPIDHFDIKEPAPAVMISLKNYGTRVGSKKLWEFFVDPTKPLSLDDVEAMRNYCENDLNVTIDLYRAIEGEIELRSHMSSKYGIDLRSKSGAQVAEAILLTETGYKGSKPAVPISIEYTAPSCVSFASHELSQLKLKLESEKFIINPNNGQPIEPDWMKKFTIKIGETKYKVGLGGIHDQRKKSCYVTSPTHLVMDIDVASYYPSMIIQFGYAPKHIGNGFYEAYKRIYTTRLEAKRTKDKLTDKSLKLVLNSTFGKFGSMYSKLYAPDLMLQVTLTGQLMLLMLIEWLELVGAEVFYANTDGITLYCERDKQEVINYVISSWETVTGMVMETTIFRRTAIRDVNNFINITEDGEVKSKGIYAESWAYSKNQSPIMLQKGIQSPIVFEAVRRYVKEGVLVKHTILTCTEVGQFLSARTVKGGAVYGEQQIGKMVRWYYSTDGQPIRYASNGNLVAKTNEANGVTPMMDITDQLPANLNFNWYIDEAKTMIEDLGVFYV